MRSSKSRSRNKSNRQRSLGNIVNRVFDSSGPEGKVRGTPQQIIDKYLTLARDAQLSNDRVAEQSFFQHAEHYTRMLGEAQREMAERQQQQQQQRQNNDDDRDGQGQNNGGHQNGHRDNRHRGENSNHRDNAQPQPERAQPERAQQPENAPAQPAAEPQHSAVEEAQPLAEDAASEKAAPQRRTRARRKPEPTEVKSDETAPQQELGLPDALTPEGAGEDGPVETPETAPAKKPRAKTTRPRTPRSTTGRNRRKSDDADGGDTPAPAASQGDAE